MSFDRKRVQPELDGGVPESKRKDILRLWALHNELHLSIGQANKSWTYSVTKGLDYNATTPTRWRSQCDFIIIFEK